MRRILSLAIMTVMTLALTISGTVFAEEADTTKPAMTISAANPSSVDEGGKVTYTVATTDNVGVVAFSLRATDITMVGFTADVSIVKTSAFVRTVTFTNIKSTNDSVKGFIIGEGVSKDAAGNVNKIKNAPTFTINTKVIEEEKDTTRPAMTISAANPSAIYAGEKVSYKVSATDNEEVKSFNLTSSDIKMVGFTADVSITGSGLTRTVIFTNVKGTVGGDKYFVVAEGVAKDAAGNVTKAKNAPAFTIKEKVVEEKDTTRPAMTISAANPSAIYVGEKVVYTVSVNDNVGIKSFNLTKADIKMVGFTADVSITGSGLTRTVTFTNVKGTVGGNKYFVVAEGVAKDAAGNVTKAKNAPAFTIKEKVVEEKDTTRPAMTISAANPSAIYVGEKVVYTVSVNDNVGIKSFNLTKADIRMVGFTADVTITGSGLTRTVTFTNVKGTVGGNKYFVVAEGVAKDAAGNVTKAKNSPAFTIKEKVQQPVEKPVEKPTQKPVKDVTPNTGREEVNVAPVVAVASTMMLAGVVVAKKYSANNCK